MHPTADTLLLIFGNLAGRRVMPGVRRSEVSKSGESMKNRLIIFTVLLLLTISCSDGNVQNSQSYKLRSGKQIKVSGVGRMNFSNGGTATNWGTALVLNYETEIPIENMAALRREVDEIWGVFRADVEKAGVGAGVIRATHYEGSGLVRDGKGYGFIYTRGYDGKWRLQE